MTVFVRPAREADAEIFTKWYSGTDTFHLDIFEFPETYTLCAFTSQKILGFMVVKFDQSKQLLDRFVPNPEVSNLEQALASAEMLKTVIALGYIRGLNEIYFIGNNSGTNRIASHIFTEIPNDGEYPMFRLMLKDLECPEYLVPLVR